MEADKYMKIFKSFCFGICGGLLYLSIYIVSDSFQKSNKKLETKTKQYDSLSTVIQKERKGFLAVLNEINQESLISERKIDTIYLEKKVFVEPNYWRFVFVGKVGKDSVILLGSNDGVDWTEVKTDTNYAKRNQKYRRK